MSDLPPDPPTSEESAMAEIQSLINQNAALKARVAELEGARTLANGNVVSELEYYRLRFPTSMAGLDGAANAAIRREEKQGE